MQYIIANNNDGSYEIEGITQNPSGYVVQFEPIDVVNGKMVALDDEGKLYNFYAKNHGSKEIVKPVSIVNTGQWDTDAGEPKLDLSTDDRVINKIKETVNQIISKSDNKVGSTQGIASQLLKLQPDLYLD